MRGITTVPETVRISANLAPEVVDALRSLAERRGTTMTAVLRRAISLEQFLDERLRDGGRLMIEDEDEKLSTVVRY